MVLWKLVDSSSSLPLYGVQGPLYIAAPVLLPAWWAGRDTTVGAQILVFGLGQQEIKLLSWQRRGSASDVSFVGLCRPGLLSPKR